MMFRGWSDIGITPDDFQRLWDLPAGAFTARMKALKKEKGKSNFFPKQRYRVKLVKVQTIYVEGESEDAVRRDVLSRSNPFWGEVVSEQLLFERVL